MARREGVVFCREGEWHTLCETAGWSRLSSGELQNPGEHPGDENQQQKARYKNALEEGIPLRIPFSVINGEKEGAHNRCPQNPEMVIRQLLNEMSASRMLRLTHLLEHPVPPVLQPELSRKSPIIKEKNGNLENSINEGYNRKGSPVPFS